MILAFFSLHDTTAFPIIKKSIWPTEHASKKKTKERGRLQQPIKHLFLESGAAHFTNVMWLRQGLR